MDLKRIGSLKMGETIMCVGDIQKAREKIEEFEKEDWTNKWWREELARARHDKKGVYVIGTNGHKIYYLKYNKQGVLLACWDKTW